MLLWGRMVGVTELAILMVGDLLTGVGITVGYHRLFTHRASRLSPGALHVRGARTDGRRGRRARVGRGSPQAPPVLRPGRRPAQPARGLRRKVADALRGLWHAHTGWLFSEAGRADQARYAKDLLEDKGLRVIARLFLPLVIVSLLLPAIAGWLLIGGWYGFLAGLFWGGAVRIFLLHHVTFSINSICHFWGGAASSRATSRATSGGFPGSPSASPGTTTTTPSPPPRSTACARLEIDPGGWVIWTLEKLGLVWNVVRIPVEKQSASSPRAPS